MWSELTSLSLEVKTMRTLGAIVNDSDVCECVASGRSKRGGSRKKRRNFIYSPFEPGFESYVEVLLACRLRAVGMHAPHQAHLSRRPCQLLKPGAVVLCMDHRCIDTVHTLSPSINLIGRIRMTIRSQKLTDSRRKLILPRRSLSTSTETRTKMLPTSR